MTGKIFKNSPPFAASRGDIRDLDVIIATLPLIAWAVFMNGQYAMLFITIGVISSVVFELVAEILLYKNIGNDIVNAILTGLLVSLSVSPDSPVWLPVVGCAAAIFVAKYQLVVFAKYGSLFSPAALGMLVCGLYPENKNLFVEGLRNALYPDDGMLNVFLGNTEGALGAVSGMLVTVAAIYLICRKALSLKTVIAGLVAMGGLAISVVPQWTTFSDNMIYQVIGGGFLFYLVFAAGDRMGAPVTGMGKLIYGAGFAALVFLFRFYTNLPVPEAFGVVIMNILTPFIDLYTRQSPFGGSVRTSKKQEEIPDKPVKNTK
ncbi:MAG: hypothetical protein E7633_07170 [Ruminococcaceae bacterium]|nr:hypothetical protein [Oscillospiraceae bacterium]